MKKLLITAIGLLACLSIYSQSRSVKQYNSHVLQIASGDTLIKHVTGDSTKISATNKLIIEQEDTIEIDAPTILLNGSLLFGGVVDFADSVTFQDRVVFQDTAYIPLIKSSVNGGLLFENDDDYFQLTTDAGVKATSWMRMTADSLSFNTDSLIVRIQSADGSVTTNNSTAFTIRDMNNRNLMMMKYHGGVAIGWNAGNNDNGADLLAIGFDAAKNLQFVVGGHNSVFLGAHAGKEVTTGTDCVYIGENAGRDDQTATFNTYVGQGSGVGTLGSVSQYNTGLGGLSLKALTTGDLNTFGGYLSGGNITSGENNTGFGNGSGGYQNAATGDNNASFGYLTGRDLKAGANNSFYGASSANTLEDGNNNAWFGYNTGNGIVTGTGSVLIGANVGSNIGDAGASNMLMIDNSNTNTPLIEGDFANDSVRVNGVFQVTGNLSFQSAILNPSLMRLTEEGDSNIHIGLNAGNWGNKNIFIGEDCGTSNTGNANFVIGYQAMAGLNTANQNVGMGNKVFNANTSGAKGVFLGHLAGQNNTTGSENVFIGKEAGGNNQTGTGIVAVGTEALEGSGLWSQSFNTAIGHNAGQLSTVDSCIYVGSFAGENNAVSQRLMIDNTNTNTPLIDGDLLNNELTINGDLEVTDTIYSNGSATYKECKNLADDATWDLPSGVTIMGTIMVDADNEFATFHVQDDATVVLVNNLGSVVNTNTDTNLCIFDNGSAARISNRLGASKDVCIDIMYKVQ